MKPVVALLAFASCCFAGDYKPVVPAGAAVYVEPGTRLDKILAAAFESRHVPLRIVDSPQEADYTLSGIVVHSTDMVDSRTWGPTYFPSTYEPILLTSKSGEMVWKYVVSKSTLKRGDQRVADAVARHIGEVVLKSTKP